MGIREARQIGDRPLVDGRDVLLHLGSGLRDALPGECQDGRTEVEQGHLIAQGCQVNRIATRASSGVQEVLSGGNRGEVLHQRVPRNEVLQPGLGAGLKAVPLALGVGVVCRAHLMKSLSHL